MSVSHQNNIGNHFAGSPFTVKIYNLDTFLLGYVFTDDIDDCSLQLIHSNYLRSMAFLVDLGLANQNQAHIAITTGLQISNAHIVE